MGFVVSALPFFVIGVLVGRWWIASLSLAFWALFYLGLRQGWWGGGCCGEFWKLTIAIDIVLGVGAALAGVAVRRSLTRASRRR